MKKKRNTDRSQLPGAWSRKCVTAKEQRPAGRRS